jgi:hypothetical protein
MRGDNVIVARGPVFVHSQVRRILLADKKEVKYLS